MDRASQRAVLEQLTMLDDTAGRAGTALPAASARTQIHRITGGWRELLADHEPTKRGRCPVCSGWLRRRKWPCQVWITAHQQLIGDPYGVDDAHGDDSPTTPIRTSSRRPRDVEVVARGTGDLDDESDEPHDRRPQPARPEPEPGPIELPVPTMRTAPQTGLPRFGSDGQVHRAAVIGRLPASPARSRQPAP